MFQIQALSFNLDEDEDEEGDEDEVPSLKRKPESTITSESVADVPIKEEPLDQDLNEYMAAMEQQAIDKMMGERNSGVNLHWMPHMPH